MGADRLKTIKDQAKRGWNETARRLLHPSQLSLFDLDPTIGGRSFRVLLNDDAQAIVGDELLLHSLRATNSLHADQSGSASIPTYQHQYSTNFEHMARFALRSLA